MGRATAAWRREEVGDNAQDSPDEKEQKPPKDWEADEWGGTGRHIDQRPGRAFFMVLPDVAC